MKKSLLKKKLNTPEAERRQELVALLTAIPDYELSEVLREVFESRWPYPESRAYTRNHFVFGIASSNLLRENKDEGQVWEDWHVSIIAYPERDDYGNSASTRLGFCEGGMSCNTCCTTIVSNNNRAECAVCGARNGVT